MTAILLAAILYADLRVVLPDGRELSASRVVAYPDAQAVLIYEAPIFKDGFE